MNILIIKRKDLKISTKGDSLIKILKSYEILFLLQTFLIKNSYQYDFIIYNEPNRIKFLKSKGKFNLNCVINIDDEAQKKIDYIRTIKIDDYKHFYEFFNITNMFDVLKLHGRIS